MPLSKQLLLNCSYFLTLNSEKAVTKNVFKSNELLINVIIYLDSIYLFNNEKIKLFINVKKVSLK